MGNRRVNMDTAILPDPQRCRWLEANGVDPMRVWASQEVLVTDTHLAYVGYPPGPKRQVKYGEAWVKKAYVVPLVQPPESFGIEVRPEDA